MLKRFPHTITYNLEGTPSGIDPDTGLPTGGTEGEEVSIDCRYEPNVRQSYVIKEDDGQRIVFKGLVHMAKSSEKIPFGQSVIVTDSDQEMASGNVVRSHKNQVHSQSWI